MSERDETSLYAATALYRWDSVRLEGLPYGVFGGMNDKSVGFIPVFDDVDKLKAAYPDADALEIVKEGG